jgi:hypothetical protein
MSGYRVLSPRTCACYMPLAMAGKGRALRNTRTVERAPARTTSFLISKRPLAPRTNVAERDALDVDSTVRKLDLKCSHAREATAI